MHLQGLFVGEWFAKGNVFHDIRVRVELDREAAVFGAQGDEFKASGAQGWLGLSHIE